MFYSRNEIRDFFKSSQQLSSFFEIVKDNNGILDTEGFTWHSEHLIENEDCAILCLLALRAIRHKVIDTLYRTSDDDINTAITEMLFVAKKIYDHSYRCYKFHSDSDEFIYDENAINWVRNLFLRFLHTLDRLGDITIDYSGWLTYSSEDHIKETLLNIIHDPILLDHIPMDVLALIDKEYYTKTYEELNDEKAMASWFEIVDSLTEDQLENISSIKLFIYEALGNKFPSWTINAIKQKLTDKIKTLKNPQSSSQITNNFNAPVGVVAHNIEKQNIKK